MTLAIRALGILYVSAATATVTTVAYLGSVAAIS